MKFKDWLIIFAGLILEGIFILGAMVLGGKIAQIFFTSEIIIYMLSIISCIIGICIMEVFIDKFVK